jgi:hypothetical protein
MDDEELWNMRAEKGALVISHRNIWFEFLLEEAASSLRIKNESVDLRVTVEELIAKPLDRAPFADDLADEVRTALLGATVADDATQLGGWRVLKRKTTAKIGGPTELFAFNHASWPVALAALTSGNGWLLVIEKSPTPTFKTLLPANITVEGLV